MNNRKLSEPGKWYAEFDGGGVCTGVVRDASCFRLLGYENEEEYGKALGDKKETIHPEDAERVNRHLADCLAKHPEGMDLDIEYRRMTRRGWRRVREYGRCLRREDGSLVRCDGIIFDIQDMEDGETRLRHERLRGEVLNYMIDHDDDPIELLKSFAERIRVLLDCDQVIYRDLEETRIMVNSPAIEESWHVPIEYCRQCLHFDAHHPMYAGGYTEMENCQEGWQGIPVYHECPIKSSLTRIVYCDGEIAGYLAIHFVQKYHAFTNAERETLEEFTRILSISLSRYAARTKNAELARELELKRQLEAQKAKLEEALTFTDYFLGTYVSAYYVNLDSLDCQVYKRSEELEREYPIITNYLDSLTEYIGRDVHPEDRASLLAVVQPRRMRELLREHSEYHHIFRDMSGGTEKYYLMQVIRGADEGSAAFGFRDVSEEVRDQRKRMLGAVPLSPDILAKANIGLWAFELDEGQPPRMYADETMLGLLGLKEQLPPEEIWHVWYDSIDESSRALVNDAVDKMVSGEHAEVQYPWRDPEGHMLVVRCGGMRNPEYRNGVRLEGTHQNVTEVVRFDEEERKRLRREQALTLSLATQQRRFKSFGDMVNAALWEIDIDDRGGIVRVGWSDEMRHMFGFENAEEFPDTMEAWSSRIHPEDLERAMGHFDDARHSGETGDFAYDNEYRILRKNGEYGWYRAVGRMEPGVGGNRTMYGIIYDISSDKRLAEQLALSDGLAREYHTVWLVEGSGEHRLHLFRSTGVRTVGRAVQRGIDEPFYDGTMVKYVMDSVHEDDRERVLEASRFETVQRETPDTGTYVVSYRRYCDDNGGVDYHQMCFAKAAAEDGTVNYILAFRDADRMLREQLAQQKQLADALSMAESANRAKTTFLNNMSHDIRTPMNAIIGYTGLAASHIDNREQVRDYLAKIAQSSDHLLSLINDVLDMSRIESGKMNLSEKEENLSDIIHTLRDIVQADIRSKQLDFYVDAVDVNDEDIVCDKLRLNQVLLNILSNSIKYTPSGGTVTLRIAEKTVSPGGYASYEFRIRDNGMGMDAEFLKTIFDPFTRVRSSTVSGIQGTGLGMAITKNIVDMMGGTITVESEPGKGTTTVVLFDFRLQKAPKKPVEIPELLGVRALVADDDADTCLSVCGMVRDIGMRYEWCTSGREAVIRAGAAFRAGDPFRVCIIDWLMPDMNGIETTRRIRRVIGDETPIIILTAYDWSDVEDEAREAGVTAFVSKPMFPSDLHRVLSDCVGRETEVVQEAAREWDFVGKKLLLVEDNELNREIAAEILKEEGFILDTAEDGDVAVEKLRNASAGDYDIVLMDVQMPRMDGYAATQAIRALGTEISKIPIIAMTANAFEEDRALALQAGMNEHVAKPIDITKLKEVLSAQLGNG